MRLPWTVKKSQEGDACKLMVNVANAKKGVTLTIRLKVVDPATGLLMAPIIYSENYFSLIPGEARQIAVEYWASRIAGKDVKAMVEGWNVTEKELLPV